MCGRFNVIDNPDLQSLLRDLGIDAGLPSRSNIAPTEMIAAVRHSESGNELADLRWWLTPSWAPQVDQKYAMFNARSETLSTSRAFSKPFRHRRCIVPMTSFIEWTKEGNLRQPWLIAAPDRALAVAGIWDRWEKHGNVVESCALLTTAAAPQFSHIHKRMPVLLGEGDMGRWLDCSVAIAANDALFASQLKYDLCLDPLSREVNNARIKDETLLQPLAQGQLLYA